MSARDVLTKMMEQSRDCTNLHPTLVYRYGWDFVLQHGKFQDPIQKFPKGIARGGPKQCFANSVLLAAFRKFKYIEGYALAPGIPIPIHHAWNEDADGNLIDATWLNSGLAYCGVEFSVERADDATWAGDASVLNDYRRKYPIFQKRWTGEDFSIEWPKSVQLELMRAGKFEELYDLVAREVESWDGEIETSHGGPIASNSWHDRGNSTESVEVRIVATGNERQ